MSLVVEELPIVSPKHFIRCQSLWLDLDCGQKFVFFEALAGPCVNLAAQLQLITHHTFSFFYFPTTLHCLQLTLET